ncbi:hypothetical protein LBMAG48_25130 [Phycisphaerae bacterium]|nr:hypothetical protein LBMAG48_25130 [Phycisphaerae bacterium]
MPDWLPGEPGKTIGGTVSAFTNFDPDGAGPLHNLLIAGGSGLNVDGYRTQKIMGFNGQNWQPLEGTNGSGSVLALTIFSNQLIAGGSFTTVSGVAASNIARWNGTTWSPMSSGFTGGDVRALAVFNNELYAAGTFTTASGSPANRIARWNGSAWVAVQNGINIGGTGTVNALHAFNGLLFVGGNFTVAGATAASNLATWNGTTWASFGNPDNTVNALGSFSGITINSNRIFIGGAFANIGGIAANRVATLRFDPISGNTWSALSNTDLFSPSCTSLLIRSSGVSSFQVNATFRYSISFPIGSRSYVSRWNGTTWAELGLSNTLCLGNYNGQIVAGVGGTPACLAYDNTNWNELGRGNPAKIEAIANIGTDVVAAVSNTVQRRSSSGLWNRVGGFANGFVRSLLVLPNNDIVAAGQFASFGGSTNDIAQWDGTNWTPLGTGFAGPADTSVNALARMPNGDIIAAGSFATAGGLGALNIARWNGFAWSPVGIGIGGQVFALKVAANGDVYAGGVFSTASGAATNNVARWDGANWRPLGTGINGQVRAIEQLPDNSIVVTGFFNIAGGIPVNSIARWNGTTWSTLGAGITDIGGNAGVGYAIKLLPSGDLVVAGNFQNAGGVLASKIARWNGSTWSALNSGLRDADVAGTGALGLAVLADNTLAVCGEFDLAGTSVSANFALWGLPASGCCDDIDFNNNTVFPEDADVIDFFNVLAGGECSAGNTCSDIDFNNNTVFPEDADVIDFFTVLAGGECS